MPRTRYELSFKCHHLIYLPPNKSSRHLTYLDFNCQMQELAELSVSKKYISSIAWSPSDSYLMAVAANDTPISLVKRNSETGVFAETGRLEGHKSSVTCVSWSKKNKNCLVSASSDCTVRVWDTEVLECVAWIESDCRMTCAVFMPTG